MNSNRSYARQAINWAPMMSSTKFAATLGSFVLACCVMLALSASIAAAQSRDLNGDDEGSGSGHGGHFIAPIVTTPPIQLVNEGNDPGDSDPVKRMSVSYGLGLQSNVHTGISRLYQFFASLRQVAAVKSSRQVNLKSR